MPLKFTFSHHTGCSNKEDHYDLFLEDEGGLITFSMKSPTIYGQECIRIRDHRKIYLDFEGKIDDEKGDVKIMETGGLEIVKKDPKMLICRLGGKEESKIRIEKKEGDTWLIEKIP